MKVAKGTVTASTVNGGTSVVDLSSVFSASEPLRWIKVWAAYNTADGTVADARISVGFGTNDGGSIQQGGVAVYDKGSGNAASDVAIGHNTTWIIKGFSDATPTTDFRVDLTAFSATGFTLTYTDAPASAIIIHYEAFGGSDVSAARVGSVGMSGGSGTTQDVTVAASWGQPSLLFNLCTMESALTDGAVPSNGVAVSLGVGASDTVRQSSTMGVTDGSAAANVGAWQKQRFALLANNATSAYGEVDLSALASWPTDGFQLSKVVFGAGTRQMIYLAIKGTFSTAIGVRTALTTGSTDDIAAGFAPAGALLWGTNLAAITTITTNDADLGQFVIGGMDGTNEGCASWINDDAKATMATFAQHSTAKALQYYTPVTPTLVSEADASFATTNLRLTWTTLDTVAREFVYVIFGPASSGTPVSATASAVVESTGAATAAATAPVEALAALDATRSAGLEATAVVAASASAPVEASVGIAATAGQAWEAAAGVGGTAVGSWETTAPASRVATGAWEAQVAVSATAASPVEATGGVAAQATGAWEAAGQTTATGSVAYEALAPVSAIASAPVEGTQALAASSLAAWEATQGVERTTVTPWEAGLLLAVALASSWEATGPAAATGSSPVDATQGTAATKAAAWEALLGLAVAASAVWEAEGSATVPVSAVASMVVEALQGLAATASAPLDAPGAAMTVAGATYEATGLSVGTAQAFAEATQPLAATRTAAYEATVGIAAAAAASWEATGSVAGVASGPLDSSAPVSVTFSSSVEALALAAAITSTAWEAPAGASSIVSMPLEARGQVTSTASMPWEAIAPFVTFLYDGDDAATWTFDGDDVRAYTFDGDDVAMATYDGD